MARLRDDTTNGLATFVEERERLIALARSFVRDAAVAEDLVQDSWLRWHGRRYQEADAKSIFRTIVVNLARDWWRRRQTERAALDALAVIPEAVPTTERVVIARDDLARVVATLEQMPPRTRAAFEMSWLEGMTLSEIGSRLGVSKTRVHQMVAKTLVELALCLEDQ